MKTRILFFFSLFCCFTMSAQQAWQWAYGAGGPGNDMPNSVSTSPSGNSYVTGHFFATAAFGAQSLTTYGYPDIFIAKYDAGGTCLWARHAGSSDLNDINGDDGTGIDIDKAGNCYVTGNFLGQGIFGTDTIGSATATGRNIFLAKYDSNGNELWARCPVNGGTGYNFSRSVSVDSIGNSWITGYLASGSNTFGAFTLSGTGGFVVKYDPNGNVIFATKLGTNGGGFDFMGVTNDNYGNAYVSGYLQGTELIGAQTFTSTAMRDPVLLKIDASGNFSWLQQGLLACSLTSKMGNGFSVCCDPQNNVYTCGRVEADVAFGNDTVFVMQQQTSQQEIYLVKYDPNGNELWAEQSVKQSASGTSIAHSITCDHKGNIYMTGGFSVDLLFDSHAMNNNATGVNAFIAMFEPTAGNCQFTIASTGMNPGAYGNGISVDASGGTYIVGLDKGPDVFGSFTPPYIGAEDMFIAKIHNDSANAVGELENPVPVSLTGVPGAFYLTVGEEAFVKEAPHFILYDVAGRVVKDQLIYSPEAFIDKSGLAAGIYTWVLNGKEQRFAAGKISTF